MIFLKIKNICSWVRDVARGRILAYHLSEPGVYIQYKVYLCAKGKLLLILFLASHCNETCISFFSFLNNKSDDFSVYLPFMSEFYGTC